MTDRRVSVIRASRFISTRTGTVFKTVLRTTASGGSGSGPSLSNSTPAALGTAAAGTATTASRGDHVHAMPTAAQVGALAVGVGAGGVLSGTLPNPGFAVDMVEQTEMVAYVAAQIDAAIAALIDGAPGALDTLNELAAAINDDASFAAAVTSALAAKVPTSRTLAGVDLVDDVSATELAAALGMPRMPGTVPLTSGDYVLLSAPFGTGNQNASPAGSALSSNSAAKYVPFYVARRIGVSALVLEVVAGNAGGSAVIRMGIHADAPGRPGAVVVDAGTASAGAAVKELTFTETFLDPGWYWAVFAFQSLDTAGTNPTVRAVSAMNSSAPRTAVPGSTANQGVSFGATVAGALGANPTVAASTTFIPHIWLKVSTA